MERCKVGPQPPAYKWNGTLFLENDDYPFSAVVLDLEHINVEDFDVCASRVSHASHVVRLLCQLNRDEIERMAGCFTFRNVPYTCNTVLFMAWLGRGLLLKSQLTRRNLGFWRMTREILAFLGLANL